MKKLFVFKTSEKWDWCEGGLVVIANSFKEAKKLVMEEEREDVRLKESKYKEDWQYWVLVEEFEIKSDESRIVVANYNWG